MNLRRDWWKVLGVLLVMYTIVMGFLGDVPRLPILNESIRNLYFHVAMWMTMLVMLAVSLVYSIRYLSSLDRDHDTVAMSAAHVGILVSVIGILTGMLWARHTWGAYWVNDPKLNGAAITLLAYLAYFVLRGAVVDEDKRARIAAVYNVFAFVIMIVFIQILPRLTDSLHPGNGGNPAFSSYDLDNRMRMVFYPAVIGWSLIATWILNLKVRLHRLETYQNRLTEWNDQPNNGKNMMFKNVKDKILITAGIGLMTSAIYGQSIEPEMADAFRADGKIYVVVAVCLIVLLGLVMYLTGIDRRLRKLEDTTKKN